MSGRDVWLKPKFRYADFHRNFPAKKVVDTNHESRRHKPSWHVEFSTFVICVHDFFRGEVSVKVGVTEFRLNHAYWQPSSDAVSHRLHPLVIHWFLSSAAMHPPRARGSRYTRSPLKTTYCLPSSCASMAQQSSRCTQAFSWCIRRHFVTMIVYCQLLHHFLLTARAYYSNFFWHMAQYKSYRCKKTFQK